MSACCVFGGRGFLLLPPLAAVWVGLGWVGLGWCRCLLAAAAAVWCSGAGAGFLACGAGGACAACFVPPAGCCCCRLFAALLPVFVLRLLTVGWWLWMELGGACAGVVMVSRSVLRVAAVCCYCCCCCVRCRVLCMLRAWRVLGVVGLRVWLSRGCSCVHSMVTFE